MELTRSVKMKLQANLRAIHDTYPESPRMMTFSNTFFLEVILEAVGRRKHSELKKL